MIRGIIVASDSLVLAVLRGVDSMLDELESGSCPDEEVLRLRIKDVLDDLVSMIAGGALFSDYEDAVDALWERFLKD